MKKILFVLVLFSFIALPVIAEVVPPPKKVPEAKDPLVVMERIVDWLFSALLIFAAIMIVVAGFTFITAAGEMEKVKTARNFVLYALIGVLVAFLARGMIWLVERIVGPT